MAFVFPAVSVAMTYLINALIAFVVVFLIDKVVSHDVEPKHALILSLVSFVAVPLVAPFVGAFEKNAVLVLSFVSWVILGEVLLQSDLMAKAKVLVIAFFIYYVLLIFAADAINGIILRYIPL